MNKFIGLTVSFLVLNFLTSSVNACTVSESPLRKQFRKADSVFLGKVLNVVEYKPTETELASVPENWKNWKVWSKVTFEIEKKWKGNAVKKAEFLAVAYFICGCETTVSQYEAGSSYLVFSEKKNFVFVCGSGDTNEAARKIKRIDNFGFRFWSRIYPF